MGRHTDPRGLKLGQHQVGGEGSGWFPDDRFPLKSIVVILLGVICGGGGFGFLLWRAVLLALEVPHQ